MKFYLYYKQWGNRIFFSYIDEDGKTHHTTVNDYKPSLYTKHDEGKARSIFGYPLKQIDFDCIKSAKNFYEQYKDVDGMKSHLKDSFSKAEKKHGGEEANNERFEPAQFGCLPDIVRRMLEKLKSSHSFFGEPASRRCRGRTRIRFGGCRGTS
jgi:hypothetical protein